MTCRRRGRRHWGYDKTQYVLKDINGINPYTQIGIKKSQKGELSGNK